MSFITSQPTTWLAGDMNERRLPGYVLARRVGVALTGVTVALLVTSGIAYVLWVLAQDPTGPFTGGSLAVIDRVRWLVDVSGEFTLPTWFNAVLWVLLGLVAFAAIPFSRRRLGWVVLGCVALLASLDEMMSLHERLQDVGWHMALAAGWRITYAWVFPGIVIAAVVAVCLWPLVRALPKPSRRLVLLGGGLFLIGAVAMETLSGELIGHFGQVTWHAMAVTHLEEGLEKLGLIVAIMGLVRLFSWRGTAPGDVQIRFDDPFARPLNVRRLPPSAPAPDAPPAEADEQEPPALASA